MTPYEMDLLIHFHTTPTKHELSGTDHYLGVTKNFLRDNIIHPNDKESEYSLTDLGQAWLKSALATPLPTLAYIDSNDNVILL